ncbi:MAG: DUF1634 domain-containing protein [Elusimicrobia bacterium]|nr:DUF1634 domain-containing protein [Elusimicrobiota bacterium]
MNAGEQAERALQKRVSVALFYGCVLSAALLSCGAVLFASGSGLGPAFSLAGVAVLLSTPVLRALLLARGYWRSGERLFAAVALFVAVFILLSALGKYRP